MDQIKRIPYGKADFEAVNAEHRYYIDKTRFIPELEKTDYVFLIRPRRFGKSLLLSTLQSYYDISKKDRFAEFYRDTWILENPTAERAQYLILYFNFSAVIKDKDKVQEDFNQYCIKVINSFVADYDEYVPDRTKELIAQATDAHEKLHVLATSLKMHQHKIYLFIDEYDNFANAIIANYGSSEYQKLTREAGYFKQFFTNLKVIASGSGSGLARMFITGVSPVTMDDVTSGFNVGDNISLDLPFNEILGFTEEDVRGIIQYYRQAGVFLLDPDETLQVMKTWYNNYQFCESAETQLFNPDAILYFIKKSFEMKEMISNLIDDNLRMDYSKLRNLITIDRELNGNFTVLKGIIEEGQIVSRVQASFPQDRLTDRENFISLLYYFGLLTFSGEQYQGRPVLRIPNETIYSMIYGYIRDSYQDTGRFAVDMYDLNRRCQALAYEGDWQPVFRFIADEIERQTKIRDYIQGEKVIQAFYLAYLNITDFYLSLSEAEMSKGYADIVLKPFSIKYPDMPYAYLIELKYIPRTSSASELEKALEEKIRQSRAQLAAYQKDDFSARMLSTPPYGKVQLKKAIIVFHGWELVYTEEVN